MDMAKIGEWAFLAGVVIAVLAGVAAAGDATVITVLAVLGILVGLLNISEKETTAFLVAAIALIVTATAGFTAIDNIIAGVGTMLNAIMANIAIFVAPAALIVALKAVWSMGKK